MDGLEINTNIGMDGISIKKMFALFKYYFFLLMLKMQISKVADGKFYNIFYLLIFRENKA